jgi:arylsulfatase A-like enzyme
MLYTAQAQSEKLAKIHPNIVHVVVDNLGYADVSFCSKSNNLKVTSFLDSLAAESGIRLNNYYVQLQLQDKNLKAT